MKEMIVEEHIINEAITDFHFYRGRDCSCLMCQWTAKPEQSSCASGEWPYTIFQSVRRDHRRHDSNFWC